MGNSVLLTPWSPIRTKDIQRYRSPRSHTRHALTRISQQVQDYETNEQYEKMLLTEVKHSKPFHEFYLSFSILSSRLGMATGQIRIGYWKYPPAIISTVIDNIRPRLYPRVEIHIHIHAHQVSDIHWISIGYDKTIFSN
jgi:hypothetical protein